ncbi:MAG: HAD family hydrolase [Thermomicrobiales bacterium]
MSTTDPVVFLLDVDNTLLDNDRVSRDLRDHLTAAFGAACQEHYWAIFEELRAELGYADYLGALQRYRLEHLRDTNILAVSNYLVNYPFANRLFPESLDVIARLRAWGPTAILSDGDVVFQPRKIERSGLWDEVGGNILIYVHKEEMLGDVERRYPARHYVVVDDKLHILGRVKTIWGDRVTTVFVRQGHYAHDPRILAVAPPADRTIDRIGALLDYDLPALIGEAAIQVP